METFCATSSYWILKITFIPALSSSGLTNYTVIACQSFLNQLFVILLFYVWQIWMTQLILAISLFESILLLKCMILQFVKKKNFLLHGIYPQNTLRSLIFFDWLYFIHCLIFFSSSYHHALHCAQFFKIFHLP